MNTWGRAGSSFVGEDGVIFMLDEEHESPLSGGLYRMQACIDNREFLKTETSIVIPRHLGQAQQAGIASIQEEKR